MTVIDAHVHVLSNFAPMAPWGDLGRVDRLLHHMDECDVDKAVVLPVVAEFSPGNNQECAQWGREHPDRLAVLTDVPMHQQDAAERVLRAGEEFGAVGTSYYPPKLDERMQWMLEEACDALWQAYKDTGLVCNLQIGPSNYGSFAGVGAETSGGPLCCQSPSPALVSRRPRCPRRDVRGTAAGSGLSQFVGQSVGFLRGGGDSLGLPLSPSAGIFQPPAQGFGRRPPTVGLGLAAGQPPYHVPAEFGNNPYFCHGPGRGGIGPKCWGRTPPGFTGFKRRLIERDLSC